MGTRFTDGAGNRLWEDYSTGGAAGQGAYAAGDEIMRLDVAGCGSRIIIRPINDFVTAGGTATAQWSLDGVEWDPVPYFDPTAQAVTTSGVFALGSGKPLIFPDIGNYFRIVANQAGKFAMPMIANLIAGYTEDDGYQFSAAAPSAGGGGSGGGPATVANGADVAEGSTSDAATASGANTTVIGALRAIRDKLLGTLTTTISGTVGVTGTFFQPKQPVSAADGDLATIGTTTDAATASGANTSVVGALRAIRDRLLGTLTVSGTFFQATQPVSSADGALVTIGTTTDAATASGANTSVVGALRAIRDKLLGTIAVSGTFFQAKQPVSIAQGDDATEGSQTDTPATGTTLGAGAFSIVALLKGLYNVCNGATPAGTNSIGAVTSIDGGFATIGTTTNPATGSGTSTTVIGALRAIRDQLIASQGNAVAQSGVVMNTSAYSGGLALFKRLPSAAASTNATLIRAGVGRIYKIRGFNAAAAGRRLKLYDKATAPVPGTDTPLDVLYLPPGAFSFDNADIGWYFANGITFALTVNGADSDTTALTAGDITDLSLAYA